MLKILVVSFSFGFGAKEEDLLEMFRSYGCDADLESLEEAGDKLHIYDGVIIGTDKADAELFEKAMNLKALIKYGVGTDNIDKSAAEKHGVQVLNLPGINSEAVSEMALGLMLAVARRIAASDRGLRDGQWEKVLGNSVRSKTLGVLGGGAIGRDLIRLVSGLDMEVLVFDEIKSQEVIDLGARYVPMAELLEKSNYVSIHLPLTPQTYHLIGRAELGMMRKDAVIINTSRGGLIDEQALLNALKAEELGGAGLDVFETEPLAASGLLDLDNVVCTSHIAAYTHETLRKMDDHCVSKLVKVLKGE